MNHNGDSPMRRMVLRFWFKLYIISQVDERTKFPRNQKIGSK